MRSVASSTVSHSPSSSLPRACVCYRQQRCWSDCRVGCLSLSGVREMRLPACARWAMLSPGVTTCSLRPGGALSTPRHVRRRLDVGCGRSHLHVGYRRVRRARRRLGTSGSESDSKSSSGRRGSTLRDAARDPGICAPAARRGRRGSIAPTGTRRVFQAACGAGRSDSGTEQQRLHALVTEEFNNIRVVLGWALSEARDPADVDVALGLLGICGSTGCIAAAHQAKLACG